MVFKGTPRRRAGLADDLQAIAELMTVKRHEELPRAGERPA
jgi:hypothetical protein